ncbi:MAG: hypothetical protein SGJ19_10605 [Planctomycetia bacterium]|nr:hypothetical protein [Planctomycetia bacterium]
MVSTLLRAMVATSLAFVLASNAGATPIRLTLQPDSSLDVSLVLVGSIDGEDSATSEITGYFDAEIDFDAQGRPVGSRIVGADLNASDVSLSIPLGFPLGSLDVDASGLHLTAYTPDAPPNPPVDPVTGAFDLDQHRFRLDAGTASADSTLYSAEFDFAVEPEEFTPLDGMTGTLTQLNGPAGGPVTLVTPIALQEFVTTVDLGIFGSVDIFIELNGTLVAEGPYEPDSVAGDTNGDGAVTIEDLNNVRNNFGGTGQGDATGDGLVNIEDLNAVRNNFGTGQAAAVPEPSSLCLLAVAAMFCLTAAQFGTTGKAC